MKHIQKGKGKWKRSNIPFLRILALPHHFYYYLKYISLFCMCGCVCYHNLIFLFIYTRQILLPHTTTQQRTRSTTNNNHNVRNDNDTNKTHMYDCSNNDKNHKHHNTKNNVNNAMIFSSNNPIQLNILNPKYSL